MPGAWHKRFRICTHAEAKSSVRLVLASDTHCRQSAVEVPDGDVFIHAGDFTMDGNLRDIAAFGRWIRSLPHAHKLLIAGNHELTFEATPELALRTLGDGRNGLIYLQDSGVTIAGLSFWGAPWQPWFYDWAFNVQRGPQIAKKWGLIPAGTDVLITHGPPIKILDFVHGDHVGCADLWNRVCDVKPMLHVFGHIHAGSGTERHARTTFVNASICDEAYKPTNPVRVIDL
jgi:hypothetical protein